MESEESDREGESLVPVFEDLVDFDRWLPVEDFFAKSDDLIIGDVKAAVELRKKLREELLTGHPELKTKIRRPTRENVDWAKEQLFGGNVCAIDGTLTRSPSLSGGRARIGIAATSYSGNQIKRVLFVSYRQMAGPVANAIEYFEELKRVNRTSELLLRAVMAYSERALSLRRPEVWRFVHGELLPYELWAALGRGRPIRVRLELAKKLIEAKNVIAVVEGSHNIQLLNAGEILDCGEYLDARDLGAELREYRKGQRDDGRGAHFSQQEGQEFDEFVERYGPEIRVGVFKAGMKSYIFHAHKSQFDHAAALVMTDAAHQSIRGFPLLIDYADRILHHYLAQGDFDRQIQFKTAQHGIETLAAEIDPRRTRRA